MVISISPFVPDVMSADKMLGGVCGGVIVTGASFPPPPPHPMRNANSELLIKLFIGLNLITKLPLCPALYVSAG